MSMKYIRDTYGVPAKRGMRIEYHQPGFDVYVGRITSARGSCLWVDGSMVLHPTYQIVYLADDGTVLLDTRSPRGPRSAGSPVEASRRGR